MKEEDRDVLQFLWVSDVHKEHSQVIVLRFTCVVFSLSSIPFLLNATICQHLESRLSSDPDIVSKLLWSIYVDDEALTLYTKAKELLKEGGFNLRKFATNSTKLQGEVDRKETIESSDTMPSEHQELLRVHTRKSSEALPQRTEGAWNSVECGIRRIDGQSR